MKKQILFVLLVLVLFHAFAQDDESKKRNDILKYGIEGQVVDLITILKNEKNKEFHAEILELLELNTAPKIVEAALDYFSSLELEDGLGKAAFFIENRDVLRNTTVAAAFNYLVALKSPLAKDACIEIINLNEEKYLLAAIKLLGYTGGSEESRALVKLYEDDPLPAIRQEILLAFGRMKAIESFSVLESIIKNEDSGKVERMYAATALGELGAPEGIPLLVNAAGSTDPNVRASAISALASFDDATAQRTIIQALRDAHTAVRLAAVKAAHALDEAIPYLEYQAKNDPEKAVKEAAISALAKTGNEPSMVFLLEYMLENKNTSQYRVLAFAELVKADYNHKKLIEFMAEKQSEKDRAFFTQLARAIVTIDQPEAIAFVEILLADTDFSTRLGALQWVERNKAIQLLETVRILSESDPVENVKKRSIRTLEILASGE